MGTRQKRLSDAVITSIHNLCLRAKIRKNVQPGKPPFSHVKVGCKGVFIIQTCFPDALGVSRPPEVNGFSLWHHADLKFFVLGK